MKPCAWYVSNGQIDLAQTDLSRIRLLYIYYYYVVNGYVNHELYTVAQEPSMAKLHGGALKEADAFQMLLQVLQSMAASMVL